MRHTAAHIQVRAQMATTEQTVKYHFAQVVAASDWPLFKKFAEFNLREAATIKTTDMAIQRSLRLLARNSRKRLLIGVGVELLLKAVYLKHGYTINKLSQHGQLAFPFTFQQSAALPLLADKTFMLNDLIEHLPKVVQLSEKLVTVHGLTIAKVFRNKEGHTVTATHAFDASNYTDIASALIALYRDAFDQKLALQFAVARNQSPVWKLDVP
jgi:hypothetical protein